MAERFDDANIIVGRNAVLEAIKSGAAIDKIYVAPGDGKGSIGKIIALARKYGLHRLQDATYGAMRYVDKVCRGETGKCDFLYIQMPFPLQKEELHMQPKGQYLRAFSCGSWDNIPRRYQEMVAYARQNGLELYGLSYEKGINEVVIDTVEEYILQIEIPVRIQPNP